MDPKPLIGLGGVLLSVMASDLNDQITAVSLVDLRGGLALGHDAGTWIDSLYLSAQPLGMAVSAWFMVTFSLRRWAVFVIGFVAVTSALIPFSVDFPMLLALRTLQGLAGGMMTPLLMDTALFVLPPSIRLYGLAAYALTATFLPYVSTAVAALWLDVLREHYVFYQAIPMCSLGALLVWYGLPPADMHLERLRMFDWRAPLLIVVGVGALTTMLYQGDRLDWFASPLVCLLALVSAVCIPLLLLNEWFHPLPFLKLQMLGRRNFAYGTVGLFAFIVISAASGPLPTSFLTDVQGFRPIQASGITLEIAAAQLLLLPATAFLLDFRRVDSRFVSVVGLLFMLAACAGSSLLTIRWNDQQFYVWQALQAIGQPLVVMPLLLMATNTVRSEEEAPFASALINFPRSVAEVVAVWLLDLIRRWRGALHYERIVDQVGQSRWTVIQGEGVLPLHPAPLLADGRPRSPHAMADFAEAIRRQAEVLTLADGFIVLGVLTGAVIILVLVLPTRTLPPRLEASAS